MNKIVATEFIPRLGNGRPENGTEMLLPKAVAAARNGTQTFQSVRPAGL
jgi:hypothetical protein